MCDTFVKIGKEKSYFAKNSDRNKGELQFFHLSNGGTNLEGFLEVKPVYRNTSYPKLSAIKSFDKGYKAILSRPIWTYGAEMGVNEHGVSIGNEAVFSKGSFHKDGLLGMDILRIALHGSKDAEEALKILIHVTSNYPQGGNGGYSEKRYYDNSYIITDGKKAYVLETAGNEWAYKLIKDYHSISNSYSIKDDYLEASSKFINFKQEKERKLHAMISKGDSRANTNNDSISKPVELKDVFKALRTHKGKSITPVKGMGSVCMHKGLLINSETTASMVVEYVDKGFKVWLTGSKYPCVSLFKPFTFKNFPDKFTEKTDLEYFRKNNEISDKLISDNVFFKKGLYKIRDKFEIELAKGGIDPFEAEIVYTEEIFKLL